MEEHVPQLGPLTHESGNGDTQVDIVAPRLKSSGMVSAALPSN